MRRFRIPAYFILLVGAVFPILDLSGAVFPVHPGVMQWRFGMIGLSAGVLLAPMMMMLLIFGVSIFFGDRAVSMSIGVIAAILAIACVVAMGMFALDSLQMKRTINPQSATKFLFAMGDALLKLGMVTIAMTLLAVNALRQAGAAKKAVSTKTRPTSSPLLARASMSAPAPAAARVPESTLPESSTIPDA